MKEIRPSTTNGKTKLKVMKTTLVKDMGFKTTCMDFTSNNQDFAIIALLGIILFCVWSNFV